MKIRSIKNTWHNCLINYIPDPIRKGVGGFKDKVASLFSTNTPKQTVYREGKKLSKPKSQKQSEENKINSARNNFIVKKKKKEKKYRQYN